MMWNERCDLVFCLFIFLFVDSHFGVSENSGFPPKSSILIGFSIINRPFRGTSIVGNTHLFLGTIFLFVLMFCWDVFFPVF